MDECVAVAEAVAVAVTEAVAEADQSIHDQSIHEPTGGRAVLPWRRHGATMVSTRRFIKNLQFRAAARTKTNRGQRPELFLNPH